MLMNFDCACSKFDKHGCVIICLYGDDMLFFGRNLDVVNGTKRFLSTWFDMRDFGDAVLFLPWKQLGLKKV